MLTLNDGRTELWQWDTWRTLAVDADCSQVHFSNKVFGRSIDVDVADGVAIIPDILLQTDNDLNVWAFVGTAENGYTKISKTFKVNRRNKPADYVFTPVEQTTIAEIAAIAQSVRDDADAGLFNGEPGDNGITPHIGDNGNWYIGVTDTGKPSRGATGSPGKDGADGAPGKDGADGKPGAAGADGAKGADGITPTIGENGNWYLGETDTGKPSRGEKGDEGQPGKDGQDGSPGKDGADGHPGENGADGYSPTANVTQNDNGATITITDKNGTTTATVTNGKDGADGSPGTPGADGKSAYQYAQDGGYTGTETEFAEKLAQE